MLSKLKAILFLNNVENTVFRPLKIGIHDKKMLIRKAYKGNFNLQNCIFAMEKTRPTTFTLISLA